MLGTSRRSGAAACTLLRSVAGAPSNASLAIIAPLSPFTIPPPNACGGCISYLQCIAGSSFATAAVSKTTPTSEQSSSTSAPHDVQLGWHRKRKPLSRQRSSTIPSSSSGSSLNPGDVKRNEWLSLVHDQQRDVIAQGASLKSIGAIGSSSSSRSSGRATSRNLLPRGTAPQEHSRQNLSKTAAGTFDSASGGESTTRCSVPVAEEAARPDQNKTSFSRRGAQQHQDEKLRSQKKHRSLAAINRDFIEVARGLDIPKATALQREFLAAGGAPSLKFTGRLIRMHGKQRGVTTSLALYESSKHMCEGQSSEAHFYGAVITACARARHPPYPLPIMYAEKAREVMAEALAKGLTPPKNVWSSLMDAQAKAGLPDEAFTIFEEMQQPPYLIQPDHMMCNILVNAYSRSLPPRVLAAEQMVYNFMPSQKIIPDRITWNSLLGCYSNAGDMDGAYRVWQQMQQAGVIPNRITEFNLASAFAPCPTLAAEVVLEARAISDAFPVELKLEVSTAKGEKRSPPQMGEDDTRSFMPKHLQQQQMQLDGGSNDEPLGDALWVLDLHDMSVSVARIVLLKRLESITACVASEGLPELVYGRPFHGLEIVTGKGNHSVAAKGGVLKRAAEDLLDSKGLTFLGSESMRGGVTNGGLLLVTPGVLEIWARQQYQSTRQSVFLHQMSLRYMTLVGLVGAGAAAAYVVPKILLHM